MAFVFSWFFKALFYFVSIFLYPLGFIIGAYFYSMKDAYEREMGRKCLIISGVLTLMGIFIFVALIVGLVIFIIYNV